MKFKIFQKKDNTPAKSNRITNETIEEHRRVALDRGRQFKYPIQYEKHKVVINTILIGVAVVFILSGSLWWSLYRANLDNSLLFKVTRFIPLPVGKVDQTPIRYSDYLAQYRVSLHYYQTKEVSVDNQQSIPEEIKQRFRQQAMDNATLIALARQIAQEKKIVVSSQEKEDDLNQKRTINNERMPISEFDRVVEDYYGLSASEYRTTFIDNPLLLKKVSIEVDEPAKKLSDEINEAIKTGQDLSELAVKYRSKVDFFDSGLVKVNNSDGGRSALASNLEIGQTSKPFILNDATGYCFVQLLSRDEKNNINYRSLTIRLEELTTRLRALRDQGKVRYYIEIKQ